MYIAILQPGQLTAILQLGQLTAILQLGQLTAILQLGQLITMVLDLCLYYTLYCVHVLARVCMYTI